MRKEFLKRVVFTAYFLFGWYSITHAQNRERMARRMDSLMSILPAQKEDSIKVHNIMSVSTIKMDFAQHDGNWNDAIAWTHKARDLAKKINYKWGIGRCTWQLGICWMKKGDYAEAVKFFTDGHRISSKIGNLKLALACNLFMTECYFNLGNYQEVLRIDKSSREISSQVIAAGGSPDDTGMEHLSMRTGNAYLKLGRYDEAIGMFEKLLFKHRIVSEDQIRFAMATTQLAMKNFDEALKNFLIALKIFNSAASRTKNPETGLNGHLGNLYLQIGETYYKIGTIQKDPESKQSFKEAVNYLDKGLPLLKAGAGGKESLLQVYEMLKKACEATNDYANALRYTNLYMALKDSMFSKASYVKMADLRIQYETEKAAVLSNSKLELVKAQSDKLIADQKLEQEKIRADERVASEKTIADQNMAQQEALAKEKSNSEKSGLAAEARQEKLKLEKRQTNNLLLMSLGILLLSSVFTILYLRQRNQKKRAVENAKVVRQMAELELQSLRSQLNPHFMFNSLNSIQALILKEDTEGSYSYLSRFARLVRQLLENANKPFISLHEEIDFLQLYLALERLRVPDLNYSFSADPSLDKDNIFIPNMFLQPYVENAIWHGLSHKEKDKQLKISIYRENGTMNYEIEDNGIGRKKSGELKNGLGKKRSMGMELLNKRMQLLNKKYGSTIQTEISDLMNGNEIAGTRVSIKIPVEMGE